MLPTIRVVAIAALCVVAAPIAAQDAPLKGDAILKHPIGQLATRIVGLIAAGKIDEVMALRTKSDAADWKAASAADKKDFGDRMKERAPSPAAFADLVRKAGALTIDGESASLEASTSAGTLRQTFEREGGQWRGSFGPMFLPSDDATAAPASETRVQGADLAKHPAVDVVLQYSDLLHAGKMDEAIARLGSADAQARWKTLPAGEKKESAEFRKRITPPRADLAKAIAAGGLLLVDGTKATLNVMTIEPATAQKSSGSSTTLAIPLALDNGQWKIAR
jgi:hypothetical protein